MKFIISMNLIFEAIIPNNNTNKNNNNNNNNNPTLASLALFMRSLSLRRAAFLGSA